MSASLSPEIRSARPAFWLVIALIAAELLIISIAYKHNFEFTCRDTAPVWFCAFAGRMVLRALGILAGLALFMLARRGAVAGLLETPGPLLAGLAANLAGFALVLAPWFGLSDASPAGLVALASVSWSLGGLLVVAGLALILAPVAAWQELMRQHGLTLMLLVGVGLALPELADILLPLWRIELVTEVTFEAVLYLLAFAGYEVMSDVSLKAIGNDDFGVLVGPQCSGVEGFMLITVFLTLYIGLFRRDLRFPQVLLLYPIGLAVSWCFNVLRITVLIAIGLEGQPDLAIGAFHSYAGWLSFTLLSILLILASRAVPWFRADHQITDAATLPPFFRDPAIAQILPFLVFMFSALLASTFSENAGLLYPWRMLAVAAVLALVWPFLRALPWRIDPLAIGTGLAIAAMWIVTGSEGDGAAVPFAGLTGAALTLWIVIRVLGTTVFVPVVEEVFFRGYLFQLIAPKRQMVQMILAVVVSTVAFAALHDRWLVAAVAGLVFAGLVWRSNNVTDAILSHAVANGSIAVWVLLTGAWHII